MDILQIFKEFVELNTAFFKVKYQKRVTKQKIKFDLDLLNPENLVLTGIFKGLIYPKEITSFGSSFFPKILGTYELELSPFVNEFIKKRPQQIIDIGCAEGFYAVGLARSLPESKVYAIDISSKALEYCNKLALENNCNNIELVNGVNDKTIINFLSSELTNLILCDCEGFEKQLFTIENCSYFFKSDLIIEIHDFLDPEISNYIIKLFEKSHDINIISSIDDILKPKYYSKYIEFLRDKPYIYKTNILSENRPSVMEWFILTPKANA